MLSTGACVVPHKTVGLAATCLGMATDPTRARGVFPLTEAGSIPEEEDVTQRLCNSLFLVTSSPSLVTSHTME